MSQYKTCTQLCAELQAVMQEHQKPLFMQEHQKPSASSAVLLYSPLPNPTQSSLTFNTAITTGSSSSEHSSPMLGLSLGCRPPAHRMCRQRQPSARICHFDTCSRCFLRVLKSTIIHPVREYGTGAFTKSLIMVPPLQPNHDRSDLGSASGKRLLDGEQGQERDLKAPRGHREYGPGYCCMEIWAAPTPVLGI